MNRTGKILTAFVAGATAGAILGILFAPSKGSDTREKIKDKAKKLTGDIEDKLCKAEQKIDELKKDIGDVFQEKTKQPA